MPAFAATDAQEFLRDFGVPVINGASSALGLLREEDYDDNGYQCRRNVVRVEHDTVGTVAEGTTLTVDGRTFTVHRVVRVGDGVFDDLILAGADE